MVPTDERVIYGGEKNEETGNSMYSYDIENGPGQQPLRDAVFFGGKTIFTVRKLFGDFSKERWVLSVRQVSWKDEESLAEGWYNISGIVTASGDVSGASSSTRLCFTIFSGSYNARTRKGEVIAEVQVVPVQT